jgi:phosphatidylserine/phosphatidylglycerophosphate/cardiolipin synthase-like enzyme
MSWKGKLAACLVVLLLAFAGGGYLGYHHGASQKSEILTVFTPYDDGLEAYLDFLGEAKSTVHIAGYAFTELRIVDKLVELRSRGVSVSVLMDRDQTRGWSADSERKVIEALKAAGAEVIIGNSEKRSEIMHNKFTVIDGIAVQDGSWNYTKAANYQANVLNFHRNRYRAGKFLATWHRMHNYMKQGPQTLPHEEKPDPKAKKSR